MKRTVCGLAVFALLPISVNAAVLASFTNQATWAVAASPNQSEDFNGFGSDATFQNTSVSLNNGSVSGVPGSNGTTTNKIDAPPLEFGGFYDINGSSELLGDVVGTEAITLTFTQPISAWGGTFKGVSDGGRNTELDVFDASNTLLGTVLMASDGTNMQVQFYGFTVTGGLASKIVIGNNSSGANDVFGLDNTQFTVPEPGSLALLGVAGAMLVGFRSRRNRA